MDTLKNFIDGRWTDAPRAPAVNPATGQQTAWLPDAGVDATGGVVIPTQTISDLARRAATSNRDNFRELSMTTRLMAA